MIKTSNTNPIDKYSGDVAAFHEKVIARANQIIDSYQSGDLDPESKRSLDEIIAIVKQLSNFKFEHTQKVLALKKAQQENETSEMNSFLKFHFSILSKYNDEFVKITKLQQSIFDSKTREDINQLQNKLKEFQFSAGYCESGFVSSGATSSSNNYGFTYGSLHQTLKCLREKEPQAFELLQLCVYLNPSDINFNFFESMGKKSSVTFGSPQLLLSVLELHQLLRYDSNQKVYVLERSLRESLQLAHVQQKKESEKINQVALILKERLETFSEEELSTWHIAEECFSHVEFLFNQKFWDKVDLTIKVKLIQRVRGYVRNVLGRSDKAISFYEASLDMETKLYNGKDHSDIVITLSDLGKAWEALGHYDKAQKYCEDSLAMAKRLYKGNHPAMALSLNNLGIVYGALGYYDKAIEHCEASLQMTKRIYREAHQDVASSLDSLGKVYIYLGNSFFGEISSKNYLEAKKYYEASYEIRKKLYKDNDHPCVAYSLNNLSRISKLLKNYSKAIEYSEVSLAMINRIHVNRDHPDVACYINDLGEIYFALEQFFMARKHLEESLKIRESLYGKEDHVEIAQSLNNLGVAMDRFPDNSNRFKHGEYLKNSLSMRKRIYNGKDHPDIATTLYNLGNYSYASDAKEYFEKSLDMRKRFYQGYHIEIADTLFALGATLTREYGGLEKLKECFKASLEMRKKMYHGKDHPDIATYLYQLGWQCEPHSDGLEYRHREKLVYLAIEYYQGAIDMKIRLSSVHDVEFKQYKEALSGAKKKISECVIS